MRFILAAALLISLASAADLYGCYADSLDVITKYAGSTLGIIAMLMVFVISILYMVGEGFHKPEYIVLAKDEGFHLAVSMMVLLFFVTAMGVGCGIAQSGLDFAYENINASATNVEDKCRTDTNAPMTAQGMAACYEDMMLEDAENIIKSYTNKNIDLQLEASTYVSAQGIEGGVTYSQYAYKRTWASFMETMNSMFVLPAYVSIAGQQLLVRFFLGASGETEMVTPEGQGIQFVGPYETTTRMPAVLEYMLPMAFIMRFLPVTRQVGNMLIAFSVGIYLIIPIFIALNGAMYTYTFTTSDCERYEPLISDPVLGGCDSSYNFLTVARLYPQAFLLPNVTIAVFITFISSINKALKVLG